MAGKNRKPIRGALSRHSSKGIPRFDVGGLNQIEVTAPMPTEAERAEYFRTHDENGNLIIPNEFAAPSIPGTGVKLDEPKAYNLPYEYSLPRLGVAGIEALTTLGTGALAYPLGAAYGLGSNLLSGKYGTAEGARLADEEAAKAAEAMTYTPRSKAGRQAIEGLGDLFEASKLPPIIPELAGLQGMRRPMPDDVRAIGGKGLELAEDIRNLKDDYLNAQSGITRDRPTLGASLQRKAQSLGDIVAERQANEREFRQNYSLFPNMAEAGKSYAVFPAGAPKRNVIKPVDSSLFESHHSAFNPSQGMMRNRVFTGSPSDIVDKYTYSEVPELFGLRRSTVSDAWTDFATGKMQEMFPDLDYYGARDAFVTKYRHKPIQKDNIALEWLDEFSKTNALGLPPLDVLKANEAKAVTVAEQTFPNMLATMIGQEGKDFPVELAMKGIMLEDPKQLMKHYEDLHENKKSEIAMARTNAGLPAEGIAQKALNEINQNISTIDNELAELTQTKWAMEDQWTDRDNQPAPEGYKELTRRETKLTDEKKRLQKQAKAMEAAPALEAFNDWSMIGTDSPSSIRDTLLPSELQFYPQLDYKKDPDTGAYMLRTNEEGKLSPELVTPENEPIYIPRVSTALPELRDLMQKYIKDIQAGKTEKSPQQYYLQEAQKRGKEREAKAFAEANRAELTRQTYKSYVDSVPEDKVFGDYAAVEFTSAMTPEELARGLSIDTDELNHCVASGNRENGRHIGIYDPATGEVRDGNRSPTTGEIEQIINENYAVTSLRDRSTGKPVVTIKMKPTSSGKFNLGYISGERNGKMDLKANHVLRDYLNSRADEIEGIGSELTQHEVYDLTIRDHIKSASRLAGENAQALDLYLAAHPDTPRFATLNDVKAMVRPQRTAVVTANQPDTIDSLRNALNDVDVDQQLAINEGESNEVLAELATRRMEIVDRLNELEQRQRLNVLEQRQIVPATEREPTTDEVQEYINTMEQDDVVAAVVDSGAMTEDEALALLEEDPQSFYTSDAVHDLIYTHLVENPDILESIRDAAWEPEPPMTLPTQDLFQRINEAATIEQLDDLRMERRTRNPEFSPTENQMLMDAARDRSRELRSRTPIENMPDIITRGTMPDRVVERLNTLENLSDEALLQWLDSAERNAPNTVWHGLDEEQTREAVTAIEYEIGRRGLDGAHLGRREGGPVHMSEGGLWEGYGAPMGESPNHYQQQEDSPVHSRSNLNYGNRKYSNADVSWHEINTDVDLFNKYGVGATKQGSVVKLHNDKIKQSDISELRARYATDDGTQYAVSRRPLDRTWSVRRSDPRDQSSLSVDVSPDYKGISYTKNFAEGGAVYDHDSVSSMADELLGSMHFAEGGPALSVGRGEKLPVSRGAGLTAKGRAKANRATGSNLKAPAPHPKTEADANRRKSFCARMSGMPGPMKDENGNPTRKAASLKRWNC